MKIKYFFSDFDGTLTDDGQISLHFFNLLTEMKKRKIELVIVSGRSASWGHFFLTHFPINFAVMEAGGVILFKKDGKIVTKVLAKVAELNKLTKLTHRMRLNFPQLEMAADNVGRITDRAIELDSLKNKKTSQDVEQYLKKMNCYYSISNVHLNYSTIENSKWSGVKYLVEDVWRVSLSKILKQSFFAGDAPNDEIMFKHFTYSLGVNNILPYLKKMKSHPKVISHQSEIKGVLDFLKDVATL